MLYEALWFLGLTPNSPQSPNMVEFWYSGEHVHWNFSLLACDWIRPLPTPWMERVLVILVLSSFCVAIGLFYRIAILLVAVTFTYVLLLEAAFYQNHFYLACLVAWLLAIMPANRRFSLDAILVKRISPQHSTERVPFWTIFLLRAQLLIVYFYAGVAKIDGDWLVGEPLRTWLRQSDSALFLESFLDHQSMEILRAWLSSELAVWTFSCGGLLFDLSIGWLLLFHRTRAFAIVAMLLFHAVNFCLFPVGAFPALAIACTTAFLRPDWPTRVSTSIGSWLGIQPTTDQFSSQASRMSHRLSVPVRVVLICWLVSQTLIPLRHFAIPGHVSWTEEGHRFSWHMMLRSKGAGPFVIEVREERQPGRASTRNEIETDERQYRQVTENSSLWRDLPALVMSYEPLIGERIILNPLAADSWQRAATEARQQWRNEFGVAPAFRKTWPLRHALLHLRQAVATARQSQRNIALTGDLDIALQLDQRLQDASIDELDRSQRVLDLQEVLHRILTHDDWRKPALALFMQTSPFALQGHAHHDAPFMVVMSPELMIKGQYSAVKIDRQLWQPTAPVLVDLQRLSPAHLRALPPVIACTNFDGQELLFWNYTLDLHQGQFHLLRCSPLAQHQYANRVADEWQRRYGTRPHVHITSYVRLNHHPLRPIVDPRVDLAAVKRNHWRHNAWILTRETRTPASGYAQVPSAD